MKPLNRIPILCTASLLYLFIIGRNLSTKQTLAAARHAGSGECGQMTTWNAIRILTPEPPSLAPAGAAHTCLCLLWECRAIYAARQVLGRSVNLLPCFVRSRAGLRAIRHQADEGHCPCLQWSCTAFRWASEGRYRSYPLSDQRVCHRRRCWPSHAMMLCCR